MSVTQSQLFINTTLRSGSVEAVNGSLFTEMLNHLRKGSMFKGKYSFSLAIEISFSDPLGVHCALRIKKEK